MSSGKHAPDDPAMRIAKQIVLQLRSEGAPPPVTAVVRKVKQCLIAIPGVAQPWQA